MIGMDEGNIVTVYGLVGHSEPQTLSLDQNQTKLGSRFVYQKVSYKVVRQIEHDVEHPILYVIALDIFV